jgi:hypothetical protein
MSWKILEGHLIATTWSGAGEAISLGIWSPGDLISSEQPAIAHLELRYPSIAMVEKINLSAIGRQQLLG